mmetsp:Transcript_42092/g.101500  ORF Transcript_42092/g.101500 Transcript_42092/m.101500 type:complete len:1405 (-) Transcript_42092:1631-5845(-)
MATVAQSTQRQEENSSSLPPQSNSSEHDVPERLVWHQFQGFWWPGMFYNSLEQFNTEILAELDKRGDKTTKMKLTLHLLNQALAAKQGGSSLRQRGIVRYLGRPVFDYQQVNEEEYQSFFDFMCKYLPNLANPELFGQDNYDLYMDYHRGIDQSMAILQKAGGPSSNDNGRNWEKKAQKSWEEHNWTNAAGTQPQPQPQRQAPVPQSPNTNSVAAVSLADESMVSANTATGASSSVQQPQQSWTETPARNYSDTPAAATAATTPTLDSSPIRNMHAPWTEVLQKLCFSDWRVRASRNGKIYTHPNLPNWFTEEEVQEYVKKHYGWLGERRTTRHSNPASDSSPFKKKTFGVLWGKYLEREGWTMPKAPSPIDYYYVRPGRSVANGVEGVDYFISTEAVVDFCATVDGYQSSSGSESEVSPDARNQARAIRHAMETDDDDESTKIPPDTEDDSSLVEYLTPREQRTKPQDPAKLPTVESATESESEESRYDFSVLWPRLRDQDGWLWMSGKNHVDSSWYVPPSRVQALKEDKNAWKSWTRGIDYFVEDEEMVEFVKMKEGAGLSEEEYNAKIAASMGSTQRRAKRGSQSNASSKPAASKKSAPRKEKSQQKAKKAAEPKKKRSKAPAQSTELPKLKLPTNNKAEVRSDPTPAPRAAKENAKKKEADKKKRRSKDSDSSSRKKARKTEDLDVRFQGEFNRAPWVVNQVPTHLHNVVTGVGFTWKGSSYYLPGESSNSFTKRFASAQEAIQYCVTEGNVDFSAATPETRAPMERLMAYANVPEKQSTWRHVRAITTKETIAFLNLLGYRKSADGSWKIPEGMVEFLKKEQVASFDELILALRRSDTLIPKARRGRHGPMDDVLRKDQMLALRLRIAEGLSDEEAVSSESSEEESVATTKSKTKNSSSLPAKKASKNKELAKKTKTKPLPLTESESSPSETDNTSDGESSARADETAESAEGDNNSLSDDDSYIENAVANLRDSRIKSQRGWQLLQRVGCKWQSGYVLPNSSVQFSNQNELVEYILKKSVMELDFLAHPLPKVELKELHRYLKFQFVSLNCSETIGKALHNMQDSSKIIALLEKIGFKQLSNGCFEHERMKEDCDLHQIINIIRAQREDLLRIGQDGESRRSREKKTLGKEDDYTLRIWAAESDLPLQFFDEESNCKEALEENKLEDDEEDTDMVSDEINNLSQHSNGGDKVLEIEEAEVSNTGFIDHSSRNQDSGELLSSCTVPVSRKTSAERAEAMQPCDESGPFSPSASMQPNNCSLELMTQSRDSASNEFGYNGSNGEVMPFMTQPQGNESEDENDFTATPASLFDKAISPHERKSSSQSETAMGDAAMEDGNGSAETDGTDENPDFTPGRSKEFEMLVDEMEEDSSLQQMDEDEGKAPSNANLIPLMTQVEED